MLLRHHLLRVHELAIEAVERQTRRQNRVLDIEQAIVARGERARLGAPDFGAGVGRRHTDVDDLRHFERPIAHDAEARFVPIRIGDQVDRDGEAERARIFERRKIAAEGSALPVFLEAFLVDRLDAEEQIFDAKLAP